MELFSIVKKLYLALLLACWPCALILPLFFDRGGWYELGLFLYYVGILPLLLLPCYLCFIELGLFIGRLTDGKERPRGERVLGYITPGVAMLLVLSVIGVFSDLSPMHMVSTCLFYGLYAALPILWVIGAIKYRKRLSVKALLRSKGAWGTAVVLVVLVVIGGHGMMHVREAGYRYSSSVGWHNTYDPLEPGNS